MVLTILHPAANQSLKPEQVCPFLALRYEASKSIHILSASDIFLSPRSFSELLGITFTTYF